MVISALIAVYRLVWNHVKIFYIIPEAGARGYGGGEYFPCPGVTSYTAQKICFYQNGFYKQACAAAHMDVK